MNKNLFIILFIILIILILFFVFRLDNKDNEDRIVKGEIINVDLEARQVVIKMDNEELKLGVLPEFTKVFDAEGNELTVGELREGLNIKTDAFYQSDVDLFVVGHITIEK